jgi:hypothetical protein
MVEDLIRSTHLTVLKIGCQATAATKIPKSTFVDFITCAGRLSTLRCSGFNRHASLVSQTIGGLGKD